MKKKHPKGAVFELDAENIRSTKARIQANEGKLTLNRVNIYAVVEAENPSAQEITDFAGRQIYEIFSEDFAAVDMNLVVVINESNDSEDYKERNASTYNFLSHLSESEPLFKRVFLLSNKNEFNEILPQSHKNICDILSGIPLINSAPSHLGEILSAKMAEQGKMLFSSAGFWQKPPPKFAGNKELRMLAESLEGELNTCAHEDFSFCKGNAEAVIEAVASVASMPLRSWNLWGCSIKEAEELLYGGEARRFFEENFAAKRESEADVEPENMPLSQVAARERYLGGALDEIQKMTADVQGKLEKSEGVVCRVFQSVDYVKTKIGECYALRYELQNLCTARDKFRSEHRRLKSYIESIGEIIQNLKALPAPQPSEKPVTREFLLENAETLAPIAISLLRNDGLVRENHIVQNAQGKDCILRIIGGFSEGDLSRRFI
ncbi:MAG: hypothetical protein FWF81_05665 [Defluviitaleaceae bacterium]|nr:hypothetical protein [Defluviitaleaceae bacterium]